MTKNQLLKRQDDYYQKVNDWFISQLAKWSKKHNMYVQDYSILRMWVIGTDDTYEPYGRYRDEELDKNFGVALKDFETLMSDLDELGIRCFQGLEYSDEAKFLQ